MIIKKKMKNLKIMNIHFSKKKEIQMLILIFLIDRFRFKSLE